MSWSPSVASTWVHVSWTRLHVCCFYAHGDGVSTGFCSLFIAWDDLRFGIVIVQNHTCSIEHPFPTWPFHSFLNKKKASTDFNSGKVEDERVQRLNLSITFQLVFVTVNLKPSVKDPSHDLVHIGTYPSTPDETYTSLMKRKSLNLGFTHLPNLHPSKLIHSYLPQGLLPNPFPLNLNPLLLTNLVQVLDMEHWWLVDQDLLEKTKLGIYYWYPYLDLHSVSNTWIVSWCHRWWRLGRIPR